MATAIHSNTASNINPPRIFLGISITDARVKKVGLAFLSTVSFFAGCSLLSYGWTIGALSIPCYFVSFAFGNLITRVKDYQNPEKLAAYREEAKELTHEEVWKIHGYNNADKYNIQPLPTTLQRPFRQILATDKKEMTEYFHRMTSDWVTTFHTEFKSDPEYNEDWKTFFSEQYPKKRKSTENVIFFLSTYNDKKQKNAPAGELIQFLDSVALDRVNEIHTKFQTDLRYNHSTKEFFTEYLEQRNRNEDQKVSLKFVKDKGSVKLQAFEV